MSVQTSLGQTYSFLPNTPVTNLPFDDTVHTSVKFFRKENPTLITWRTFSIIGREQMKEYRLLNSGCFFGHQKLAVFDYDASELHAVNLLVCARKGVILSR